MFVVVGSKGLSMKCTITNTNSIKSWSTMSGLDTSKDYHSVTYGNGRFVCVGHSGSSYYSTDGLTWKSMSGLNSNTTYYYKVTTTDKAGNSTVKTGSSATNSQFTFEVGKAVYFDPILGKACTNYHEDNSKNGFNGIMQLACTLSLFSI